MLERMSPSAVAIAFTLVAWTSVGASLGCAEKAEPSSNLPGDGVVASSGTGDGGAGGATDGAGGSSTSGGGAGDPIPPCGEWEGPFGTEAQQTLDPNHFWRGYLPGEDEARDVTLEQFAACGGGDDVTAIVVYIDAMWCAVCRDVTSRLAEKYETDWKDRGVVVITLVVEDVDGNPATEESAWIWRSTYGLEAMPVAYDPEYLLANGTPDILPQAVLVDPVTMQIYGRAMGNVDLDPYIDDIVGDAE